MNTWLKLKVNSIREALVSALNGGLDNKRERAWCEYGYKKDLEFDDTYKAYRRSGVARGGIDKVINKCWSEYPTIYEGDEDDVEDEYESRLNSIMNEEFWRAFKEADRRRMIGRFSALVLYFNDGNEVGWADPVSRDAQLRFVQPAWESALTVAEWDDDGMPVKWHYQPPETAGGKRKSEVIHRSRLFILGDITSDGMSFLEPVFNNIVNLEKVEGGSSESYLKNASRQLHVNFDGDVDLRGTAEEEHNIDLGDYREAMQKVVRDLNVGNDTVLITQGANANPLVANVPDPTPVYDINLNTISAGLDIPVRILIGNQTGERASTEDLKYFNERCQSRRESELGYEIRQFIRTALFENNIVEEKDVNVKWDDLTTPTKEAMLDNVSKMADINQKSALSGGDHIFTEDEMRNEGGYEAVEASHYS